MKFHSSIAMLLSAANMAFGGQEPAPHRSFTENVRMSTHVLIGQVVDFRVINEATGLEAVKPKPDIGEGERFELSMKVSEVIYADTYRPMKEGGVIKIRFGVKGNTAELYRKLLFGKQRIFFLACDEEIAGRKNYFFPFYGSPNLSCDLTMRDEVKALVQSLSAATRR